MGRIWGDGPERERLEALSESLGLRGRLLWMGATDAPEQALAQVLREREKEGERERE